MDTGVLISAFVFGGIPEKAIKKAFSRAEIWVSPQLLKEYRDTPVELRVEGKITDAQLRSLLSGIAAFVVNAKVVVPKTKLFLCRDKEDNTVLECCLAADANLLITGDRDLLEIEQAKLKTEIPKLKIVSPRTFLRRPMRKT
ncbi:MAG TPA: putative toxin-antitoxin system toxin component, PIN family [Planctomycetia bacterium]|nr:putative toxin-antitoxin system toxin component, PIN family [Planctomycetia bacterium]